MLILFETDTEAAQMLGERLRHAISKMTVSTPAGKIRVTISGGSMTCKFCQEKHDVVEAADNALYTSKENGRDQLTRFTLEAV